MDSIREDSPVPVKTGISPLHAGYFGVWSESAPEIETRWRSEVNFELLISEQPDENMMSALRRPDEVSGIVHKSVAAVRNSPRSANQS